MNWLEQGRTRHQIGCGLFVTYLLQIGCAPAAVCSRQGGAQIDVRCVEANFREGEAVSVRDLDGAIHRGSFVRLELVADSVAFVLNQDRSRSGMAPRILSFNVAAIDSISEVRGARIPEPIPVLVELAIIGLLFHMFVASRINLSGLN